MNSRNILEVLSRWEISTGSHLKFLQINLKKGQEISRNNPKVIPRTGLWRERTIPGAQNSQRPSGRLLMSTLTSPLHCITAYPFNNFLQC